MLFRVRNSVIVEDERCLGTSREVLVDVDQPETKQDWHRRQGPRGEMQVVGHSRSTTREEAVQSLVEPWWSRRRTIDKRQSGLCLGLDETLCTGEEVSLSER